MIIEWLGHSAFLIIADNGTKIITDPYEFGASTDRMRYRSIEIAPDIVTVSHRHSDHAYVEGLNGEFEVVAQPGVKIVKGITFKGIESYHDSEYGAQRGRNIIFTMMVDRTRICHLGDLGHELSPECVESIGEVDFLLIPVGGNYTIGPKEADRVIDRIRPRIVIPMHYKTDKVDVPILPVEHFLKGKQNVSILGRPDLEIPKERLPAPIEIVVLSSRC